MTSTRTFVANDEAATVNLARQLAHQLFPGAVVALSGPLGAGKTTFVRHLAASLGIDPREVTSPTFVLAHEYGGSLPIHHLDAYRLTSAREFWELGVEESFESAGITLIEWAERVAECLPADRLEIKIEVTGLQSRQFTMIAHGERYHRLLFTKGLPSV